MKQTAMLAVILISMWMPMVAQNEDDESEEVVLPDAIMTQVISRIVTYHFKPRRSPATVYIDGKQVKEEWLPAIRNIRFVLVDSAELPEPKSGFRIEPVTLENDRYSVSVGFGTLGSPSSGSGDTWAFVIRSGRVRLWQDGGAWGWGC